MHAHLDHWRLVSIMALALRHDPARFGLELDEEGWTSFEDLIIAIRFEHHEWSHLNLSVVDSLIAGMDRFEIRDGRIRAAYGHSFELVKPPAVAIPPATLFHGTASDNYPAISQRGILKMRRRFAHLSADLDWVVRFLADKPAWTIFAVDTLRALQGGVVFRQANHHVWLADAVPKDTLTIHSQGFGLPGQA
jgi:putative RNA 2'-phosphotransferase